MVFVIHWHESAMGLHVFPIPIPLPTSLSTRSLWVFPVHQVRALVSCIQPGLVICFTLDNIHVSMLFSRNIPPLPSPTESKSLFCMSRHFDSQCHEASLGNCFTQDHASKLSYSHSSQIQAQERNQGKERDMRENNAEESWLLHVAKQGVHRIILGGEF